jgi:hypothetical protein
MRLLKGQSIIEYVMIIILVMTGIIVAGPYLLRSVNAHFKLWDDTVQDSFDDRIVEARPDQIRIDIPPDCKSCPSSWTGSCGTAQKNGPGQCDETEAVWQTHCPIGCDPTPIYSCHADETRCGCTNPMMGNCWRTALDSERLAATVPSSVQSQGFRNSCALGDRVFSFSCGENRGMQVCKTDNTTTDGNRACQPMCNVQLVGENAQLCPGAGTNLSDDINATLVENRDACNSQNPGTICEAYCKEGFELSEDKTLCGPPLPACPAPVNNVDPMSIPGLKENVGYLVNGSPAYIKFHGDNQTLAKICDFAGFKKASSFSTGFWASPSDEHLVFASGGGWAHAYGNDQFCPNPIVRADQTCNCWINQISCAEPKIPCK